MIKHIAPIAVVLIITCVGCVYSLYWVLFSAWMTAYQTTNYQIWRTNFYIWFIVFIALVIANIYGICRIIKKIKIFKRRSLPVIDL